MGFNIFPAFTCKNQNFTENQSIYLFPLYFGVFSCHCETYPIDFISLSKSLRYESYRHKNRAELFALNGSKRPIRYEFQNGVKPNRYKGNIVSFSMLLMEAVNKEIRE